LSFQPPTSRRAETFLQDLFNSLDKKQKFAVFPLVCRSWSKVAAAAAAAAIVATLPTHERLCQMYFWLAKHRPPMLQEVCLETSVLALFQDSFPFLHAFSPLKQLRSLSLTRVKSSDDSLVEKCCIYAGLSCLTSLSSLSLMHCTLLPCGRASLCKLTGLQALTLLELGLSNSQLSEEAVTNSIAQSLTQLTSFSLSFTGMLCMPLACSSALTTLSRLQKLPFGTHYLRAQQLQMFAPQLQHNSQCCVAAAAGEGALIESMLFAAGSRLHNFSLGCLHALPPTADSSGLGEAEVAHLLAHLASAAPNLQCLEFHDITSLADSCSQLGDLVHLTSLRIEGCGLTYPAIGQLSALTRLEELVLDPRSLPPDGSMQDMVAVASLPRLTRLKIWWGAGRFMEHVFGQRFLGRDMGRLLVASQLGWDTLVTLHIRSAY
jgi:hypothetical protein